MISSDKQQGRLKQAGPAVFYQLLAWGVSGLSGLGGGEKDFTISLPALPMTYRTFRSGLLSRLILPVTCYQIRCTTYNQCQPNR